MFDTTQFVGSSPTQSDYLNLVETGAASRGEYSSH
jgi:hypothetical protein